MRFSTVLQLAVASRLPVVAQARAPAAARVPDADVPDPAEAQRALPEPLDERVRLVGEWQLGEA